MILTHTLTPSRIESKNVKAFVSFIIFWVPLILIEIYLRPIEATLQNQRKIRGRALLQSTFTYQVWA